MPELHCIETCRNDRDRLFLSKFYFHCLFVFGKKSLLQVSQNVHLLVGHIFHQVPVEPFDAFLYLHGHCKSIQQINQNGSCVSCRPFKNLFGNKLHARCREEECHQNLRLTWMMIRTKTQKRKREPYSNQSEADVSFCLLDHPGKDFRALYDGIFRFTRNLKRCNPCLFQKFFSVHLTSAALQKLRSTISRNEIHFDAHSSLLTVQVSCSMSSINFFLCA